MAKRWFLVLFPLFIPQLLMAATLSSIQSGNWSDPNTWGGGRIPGDGDEVLIADGHAVWIDQDIGTPGGGLLMLRVGTKDGSAAQLKFDGALPLPGCPAECRILFASTGKTAGVDAFGIRFFGTVDFQGTAEHRLLLEPRRQDGQAYIFIEKDPESTRVRLRLKNTILRFLGDEDRAGIDARGAKQAGDRFVFVDNRMERSGSVRIGESDGAAAEIAIDRNEATDHRGPFLYFRSAQNLTIRNNRVTLASFGSTGEAVIDGYQGPGSRIAIEKNELVSRIDADGAARPVYGVWLADFSDSAVRGNRISASGVPYGFEEGISLLGRPGAASDVTVSENVISNTIHGIGIHTTVSSNPGIEITRNRVFDNRNEHIYVSHGYRVKIANNILWGSLNSGQAGILLYSSDEVQIVNNSVDGPGAPNVVGLAIGGQGASKNVLIRNNILTGWDKAIQNRPVGNAFAGVSHNLFFGNNKNYDQDPIPSAGEGDVIGDPKYAGPGSRDYHLQAGSPAIDRGASAGAPALDADGDPRPSGGGIDIGADEFAAPPPRADLAVSIKADVSQATIGASLTYTVAVANRGPDAASRVELTDLLPPGLSYRSAVPSQGSCRGAGPITCDLGPMQSGSRTLIEISVVPMEVGGVENNVFVESEPADSEPANNQARHHTFVESPVPDAPGKADLAVRLNEPPDSLIVDAPWTDTVVVANKGPDPATEVQVVFDTGPDARVLSAAPSQGRCPAESGPCELGTLEVNSEVTITRTLTPVTAGTFLNRVTVTSAVGDPDLENNADAKEMTVGAAGSGGGKPPGALPPGDFTSGSGGGFGCGTIRSGSNENRFRRSDWGDLLLLAVPFLNWFFRNRRSARVLSAARAFGMRWVLPLVMIFLPMEVQAAVITSARSGTWSDPSTWAGGQVPGDGDEVIIANGHRVQINQNVGTSAGGLLMLRVGTGSASPPAELVFDGAALPFQQGGYKLTFASTGKIVGQNAYGIRFWGKVSLKGTVKGPSERRLTIQPRVENGNAFTFIHREEQANRIDLTVSNTHLRFLGDENIFGINVDNANKAGDTVVLTENALEESGFIRLDRADGDAEGGKAKITVSKNVATSHRGSFVQFRAARNLTINENQITLASFGSDGQAIIDSRQGEGVGGLIRIEGNILTSRLNADRPDAKQIYGIWLQGFSNSNIRGNRILSEGVAYGFEEGIHVLGGAGDSIHVVIDGNVISNSIHGIGIDTTEVTNPGIEIIRNRIFDNRNEHIFISKGYQVRITNNILYGSVHPGQAGILLYNTNQVYILNNTLDGNGGKLIAGIAIGNQGIGISKDVVIRNNIITNWEEGISNRPAGNTFREVGYSLFSGNVKNYDDAGTTAPTQIPSPIGDIIGDPAYVRPGSGDFHIQGNSIAINRGSRIDAPLLDIDGQRRPDGNGFDIGADEFSDQAAADPPPSPCMNGFGPAALCDGTPGAGPDTGATSSSSLGASAGGCSMVASASNRGRRSGLGDVLLLAVPFFYAGFRKGMTRRRRRSGVIPS